ncbi:MAG: cytochrome c biogenesis protein CcsA, partial [Pseudomonadales bacterium]
PLVPALQSNWLMMHVSMMMLSYATLIIGSLLCILFLIISLSPAMLLTIFFF